MNASLSTSTLLLAVNASQEAAEAEAILGDSYQLRWANSGLEALQMAWTQEPPDMALLNLDLRELGGAACCRKLKQDPRTRRTPVLLLGPPAALAEAEKGIEAGAADFVHYPLSAPLLKARIQAHLALSNQERAFEKMVLERTQEYLETQKEIIRRLARASEFRDNETGLHVVRVSAYAFALAQGIGLPDAEAETIALVAPLHDIGKIGISDGILRKKGKLDEEEWRLMRRHPVIGAEIIGHHGSDLLQVAYRIALTHHERWDGGGYPEGLKGEDIPIEGRIVAVADVFDALTTERPYKKAWSIEEAVELLQQESGKAFDPALVDKFMEIAPIVEAIHATYIEDSSMTPL